MATPYDTVHRSGDRRRDHRRIAELAVEAEVEAVIVGLPLSLDGSDGPAAKKARREAGEIGRATGLPVELWDERLTTVTADRELMAMDLKADARRRMVDMVARSEEHTSELQSLMRISYAVFCLKKK